MAQALGNNRYHVLVCKAVIHLLALSAALCALCGALCAVFGVGSVSIRPMGKSLLRGFWWPCTRSRHEGTPARSASGLLCGFWWRSVGLSLLVVLYPPSSGKRHTGQKEPPHGSRGAAVSVFGLVCPPSDTGGGVFVGDHRELFNR